MFHDFGHGLPRDAVGRDLPSLSGTSVFTDFSRAALAAFPSIGSAAGLRQFARHYQTGEPLPDDLLKRFLRRTPIRPGLCHGGFVASALIDLEFHTQPASATRDVRAFERADELRKSGYPRRSRCGTGGNSAISSPGNHYASGYYSYMWSEVMMSDAFAPLEAGDIFDPAAPAKRLHDDIYASGGSRDPEDAGRLSRSGREPEPDALLRRRGLLDHPRPA